MAVELVPAAPPEDWTVAAGTLSPDALTLPLALPLRLPLLMPAEESPPPPPPPSPPAGADGFGWDSRYQLAEGNEVVFIFQSGVTTSNRCTHCSTNIAGAHGQRLRFRVV